MPYLVKLTGEHRDRLRMYAMEEAQRHFDTAKVVSTFERQEQHQEECSFWHVITGALSTAQEVEE